eukprot:2482990-Lingulodinium_polyedra.AAC.1
MYYRRSSKGLESGKLTDLFLFTNDVNYGALMALGDSCDDRAWLDTEPVASDLSGLRLRSL